MSYLYLSADAIGTPTGGGIVTFQESLALKELVPCDVWGRDKLLDNAPIRMAEAPEPWKWDALAGGWLNGPRGFEIGGLAHIYSGTMTGTVQLLKARGMKVCYTVAAHRVSDSKQAHGDVGLTYNLPHLTEPEQWKRYSAGYWNADALVVPSHHSRAVVVEQMNALGITNQPRICVIPHGCHVPEKVKSIPKSFVVGYLGSSGADKGLRWLFEAWKILNWNDAVLVIAGKESTNAWTRHLYETYGGGAVWFAGWQENLANFYGSLSLYIQPSSTEGFGLEVLEACAHGRPVLCSDHAGACDVVPYRSMMFPARNAEALAEAIKIVRRDWDLTEMGTACREDARHYGWYLIRERYLKLWRELLQ